MPSKGSCSLRFVYILLGFSGFNIFFQSILAEPSIQYIKQNNGGTKGSFDISTREIFLGNNYALTENGGKLSDIFTLNSFRTIGEESHGILLQSIGGGGGIKFAPSSTAKGDILMGGGVFGSSGFGGVIDFQTLKSIDIQLLGNNSIGYAFQSIGGGGGWTANTLSNAQLGGLYGDSAFASSFKHEINTSITTSGEYSHGTIFQSIGGGGGRVGNVQKSIYLGGTSKFLGTPNGDGGDLDLIFHSNIMTKGSGSIPVIVQSIGGGGGISGIVEGTAGFGGLGTGKRSAGDITVVFSGDLKSEGSNSAGFVAQSIGGGGGLSLQVNGAANFGKNSILPNTGKISAGFINTTLNKNSSIESKSDFSPGVVLQSIGGGGGYISSSGDSVLLGSGGAGTLNGDASSKSVSLNNSGIISTQGSKSPSVLIQSIGGGGGYTLGNESVSFINKQFYSDSSSANIEIDNRGIIQSSGNNSFGVLAQSISGGGGFAGSSSGNVSFENFNNSSSSGDILIINEGLISTSGDNSHGIIAQSIVGGGGFIFGGQEKFSSDTNEGNVIGDSGKITINNKGTINASGDNAIALLLHNSEGGAYLYQNPKGNVSEVTFGSINGSSSSGEILVTNSGKIVSTGLGGVGLKNSHSSKGKLKIENKVQGKVQGGKDGMAIYLSSPEGEEINNYGLILGGEDGSGVSISGIGGPDVINNFGTIRGDIKIGGLTKNLINHSEGRIEAKLIKLSENVSFDQRGVISPGGSHNISALTFTGNYVSADTSVIETDLALNNGQTDKLVFSNNAEIKGKVKIITNNEGKAKPGNFISEKIFDPKDKITIDNLKLKKPVSAVGKFNYQLVDNEKNIVLLYDIDYAPDNLDINSKSLGRAVNNIQKNGNKDFESVAAEIFKIKTTNELNNFYKQISGEVSTIQSKLFLGIIDDFHQDVFNEIDRSSISWQERCQNNNKLFREKKVNVTNECKRLRTWFNSGRKSKFNYGSNALNQADYTSNNFYNTLGLDFLDKEKTLIGLSGRLISSSSYAKYPDFLSEGDSWGGILYVKKEINSKTWVKASISKFDLKSNLTRNIKLKDSSVAKGKVFANGIGGSVEINNDLYSNDEKSLMSRIRLSWFNLTQKAYSEYINSGNYKYALKYNSAKYESIPFEIGLELRKKFKRMGKRITAKLSLGKTWNLADLSRNLRASFKLADNQEFSLKGTSQLGSFANLNTYFDIELNNSTNIYLQGSSEFASDRDMSPTYEVGIRFVF